MNVHRLLELLNNRKISFLLLEERAVKKKDVLRIVTVAWDLQLVSVYVCPGETEPCKIRKQRGKSFEIGFSPSKTTKTVSCIKTTAPLEAIVALHKNGGASGYSTRSPSCGRNSKKRNLNSTATDESDEKALHRKRDENLVGIGDVFPCRQLRKR